MIGTGTFDFSSAGDICLSGGNVEAKLRRFAAIPNQATGLDAEIQAEPGKLMMAIMKLSALVRLIGKLTFVRMDGVLYAHPVPPRARRTRVGQPQKWKRNNFGAKFLLWR